MEGLPLTRAISPDGRWAYTLYDGAQTHRNGVEHEPFIHALDTVGQRAVCIDLPQLADLQRRFFYLLRAADPQGRPGARASCAADLARRDASAARVDTRSFEVHKPSSGGQPASSGVGPWPPIVALSAGAVLLLAWIGTGTGAQEARPAARR